MDTTHQVFRSIYEKIWSTKRESQTRVVKSGKHGNACLRNPLKIIHIKLTILYFCLWGTLKTWCVVSIFIYWFSCFIQGVSLWLLISLSLLLGLIPTYQLGQASCCELYWDILTSSSQKFHLYSVIRHLWRLCWSPTLWKYANFKVSIIMKISLQWKLRYFLIFIPRHIR